MLLHAPSLPPSLPPFLLQQHIHSITHSADVVDNELVLTVVVESGDGRTEGGREGGKGGRKGGRDVRGRKKWFFGK